MNINKQTLFFYNRYDSSVQLFDIKTLTLLQFSSKEMAMLFCEQQKELQCLEDINDGRSAYKCMIYVSTENDKHKVIYMETSKINLISSESLIKSTYSNKVINLEPTNNDKIRIKWVIPPTPKGFEAKIEKQYEEFKATMRLLNGQPDFKYTIIGEYVILTFVSRQCTKLTIPPFVTSITQYSMPKSLKYLRILDGVEFIGRNALPVFQELVVEGGRNVKYAAFYESTYSWEEFKNNCNNYSIHVSK